MRTPLQDGRTRKHVARSDSSSGEPAYLILTNSVDSLDAAVADRLRADGHPVALISHPFASSNGCSWFLDDDRSACELIIGEIARTPINVAGVLVRSQPFLDPLGWEARDLAYAHAELLAAVLGWLHGLACPVINRFPSWTWYRRGPRLSDWYPSLRAAGLPFQDARLTSDISVARAFDRHLVLNPMTSDAAFLIGSDADWQALSSFLSRTPAQLTRPHGAPRFASVAGGAVIWSEPSDTASLDAPLLRFSSVTGLDFFEVAVAPVDGEERVIAVDAFPTLRHQPAANHPKLVDALVAVLTCVKIDAQESRLR